MEIKAKAKYDYETVKALDRVIAFRTLNPKTGIILFYSLFAFSLIMCCLDLVLSGDFYLLLILIMFGGLWSFLIFFYPKVHYNGMNKLQNCSVEYTFFEESIHIVTYGNGIRGEDNVDNRVILKAVETSKYLFLYQTKNSVYVVDKSTVEGGSIEDLRSRFASFLGKKYHICNY